jgi:uncharacterized protein (TIGR04255 family)
MPSRQSPFTAQLSRGYKRAIYKKNPLIEVIFQLRFPQLLTIDEKPPSGFQSRISRDYPFLEVANSLPLFVGSNEAKSAPARAYTFFSSDKLSKVSLTSSFVSFSTNKYTRWEDFLSSTKAVIKAFRVSFPEHQDNTTRTGLRYRNIIDRASFGLPNAKWDDLINPKLLGLLQSGVIPEETVRSAHCFYTLTLGEVTALFQHGLSSQSDGATSSYFLDYDFYIEEETKLSTQQVATRASLLNKWVGPLFRWSITDKLHAALKPTQI